MEHAAAGLYYLQTLNTKQFNAYVPKIKTFIQKVAMDVASSALHKGETSTSERKKQYVYLQELIKSLEEIGAQPLTKL